MELTYEETQNMIEERIGEYPEIAAIVRGESFQKTLSEILAFEHVPAEHAEQITFEIKVVLAQYAPISELAQNISESTGIALESAASLTQMVETLILEPIYSDLLVFDYVWHEELAKNASIPAANLESKERLELRPETSGEMGAKSGEEAETEGEVRQKSTVQPLTREELMSALAGKRTMASDIEAVRKMREEAKEK